MVGKTGRLIAAALFATYVGALIVVYGIVPTVGDWSYWGEPLRDGLAIASAIALGLPLAATAFGIRES